MSSNDIVNTYPVPIEVIAAMVEINCDLGYLLDDGLNPEVIEDVETINNRLTELLDKLELPASMDKKECV